MYTIYKKDQKVCEIKYDLKPNQVEAIADMFGENVVVLMQDSMVFYTT